MRIFRYALNGFFATIIHYFVLYVCVEILVFQTIGVANILASIFGIGASFLGNRYYVFIEKEGLIHQQFVKFILFYSAIALIHGVTLYLWSDMYGLDYNLGFLIAVMIQFFLGYLASKYLIFRRQSNPQANVGGKSISNGLRLGKW